MLKAPTCPPILINKNISKAGRPIKKRKNEVLDIDKKTKELSKNLRNLEYNIKNQKRVCE